MDAITEMVRRMAALEARLGRLETQERGGVWVNWTPTVTQGVAISLSGSSTAKYMITDKICHVEVQIGATSAGTAGQAIWIGGQPAAMQPVGMMMSFSPLGTWALLDQGTDWLTGLLLAEYADMWRLAYISPPYVRVLGSNFAYTIANTDSMILRATYRVA